MAELPLGAPGLPETRTEEQLAPGLRYTRIVRGKVDSRQHWTVQAALVSPGDVEATLGRIRALGLEGWQCPAGEQVSVRVGHIELRPFGDDLEKSLRAQGFPEAKVLHTSDDAEATQGPWVVHVLELDWKQFGGKVGPVLLATPRDGDSVRAALTDLAKDAIAAVNGDYFVERPEDGWPGDPTGILVNRGNLLSEAVPGRSALVLDGSRTRIVQLLVEMELRDGDQRYPVNGLNRKAGLRRDVSGHDTTQVVADELVLSSDSLSLLGLHSGKATRRLDAVGRAANLPLPRRVLVESLKWHVTEGPTELTGDYSAIGGGPQLLKNGEVAIRAAEEGFSRILYTFGLRRNPRTLAGVTDDGRLLLVVVDGRQPDWSVGATFDESALLLRSLGAKDGLNLDGGGSSTMVIRGQVVNRPSEGKPRAIGDAIVIRP